MYPHSDILYKHKMAHNLAPTSLYEDAVESAKNSILIYGPSKERQLALRKASNRLSAHVARKKPYERIAVLEQDMKRVNKQNCKLWEALITMHVLIMEKERGARSGPIGNVADAIIRPLTNDAALKSDMMQAL